MDPEQDSNTLFYGSNAGTSGSEVSEADIALMEKATNQGVVTMDGDDQVDVDISGDAGPEDTPTDPEVDPDKEADKDPEDKPKEDKKADELPTPETLTKQMAESQAELEELGKDLQAKGVDVEALVAQIAQTGEVSEANYKTLQEAGVPRSAVAAIIRGQQAMAQEVTRSFFAMVGGEANFLALSEFAVANDPGAVEAFNAAQDRGDIKTAAVILKSIQKAQEGAAKAKLGTANKMLQGRPSTPQKAPSVTPYANNSEMVAAMRDPRYGIDLKYTADVEKRVAGMA